MGVAQAEVRSSHDNKVWRIEHDGIRYDDLDIIQSILLPEKFYNKEFDILQQHTRYATVHIEKRKHPKTGKFTTSLTTVSMPILIKQNLHHSQ